MYATHSSPSRTENIGRGTRSRGESNRNGIYREEVKGNGEGGGGGINPTSLAATPFLVRHIAHLAAELATKCPSESHSSVDSSLLPTITTDLR